MPRVVKKRKVRKYKKRKIDFPIFKIFSICVLLVVDGFYLFQVNKSSTIVYEISDLKNKISELKDKKELLELDVARSQSIASINDRIKDLKMVATERIKYIETGTAVAIK